MNISLDYDGGIISIEYNNKYYSINWLKGSNIKIKTLVTTTQSKNFYFHFEATNELQQVFYNNFNMIVEL